MENTNQTTVSNKPYIDFGIKFGLILGAVLVVIKNIHWFIDPEGETIKGFIGIAMGIFYFLLFIGMLAYIGIKARQITGFITSRVAFKVLLAAVLVYCALGLVTRITLMTVYKEKMDQKWEEQKEEAYTKMEEKGLSDEDIEKQMKFVEWGKPTIVKMLIGYVFLIGIDILIALIMAQIIKKNPPYMPPVYEDSHPQTT